MDRAVTGKAFVLYLTYGSRTVNRTDSLFQTFNELVGNVDWGESLTVAACEFRGHDTSIIRSQDLDLKPRGIFYQGLQFRKFFTYFWFLFEKENPCIPWKSSIKVRRYLDPFMDVIGIGPLISECISANMLIAQFAFPRSNLCSGCFPITQPLQIPVVALMTRRPSTMEFFCNFYNIWN